MKQFDKCSFLGLILLGIYTCVNYFSEIMHMAGPSKIPSFHGHLSFSLGMKSGNLVGVKIPFVAVVDEVGVLGLWHGMVTWYDSRHA